MDQAPATPAPPTNAAPPLHRRRQLALGLLVAALLAVLLWRVYSPRFGFRPTESQTVSKQVNLNTADRVELLQVPGIGPQLADAILSHRQNVGRFEQVEELQTVRGVGPKTMEKLRPWLHVEAKVERVSQEPDVETLERKHKTPVSTTPGTSAKKIQPGEAPINLNTATEAELTRLPGIGPVLASKIASDRGDGYKTVDDVKRVKGIGTKTLDGIRPFVVVK